MTERHKRALVTGITGQDGSYLAELLLAKGYIVHGLIRRASSFNTHRIEHLYEDPQDAGRRLHLHFGDLTDASNLSRLIERIQPDEIYNLGAQSHVQVSFELPEYTAQVDGIGTLRLLDAIRDAGFRCRFCQASTSELFGKAQECPQRETTPFYPRSPYAAAKLYAHWLVINYREAYGLHASNAILFNHESPRRGKTFVTRKISMAAAAIACGTPVVTGRTGSIPEDCGEAAYYVDPCSVETNAAGVQAVLDSPALGAQLIAAGGAQAARFSWDRSAGMLAQQVVEVHRRGGP